MNIEIANRLQQLRKENGYSQEDLADKLGISRQAVSKWERAESSPDTDNLILLARLYGVSLDELLSTDESNDDIRKDSFEQTINKEKEGILIDDNGIHLNVDGQNNDIDCCKRWRPEPKYFTAIDGAIALITVIVYIIIGEFYNLWHPLWIIFILIPAVGSIFRAIYKRQISEFFFPLVVTVVYLYIGFVFNLWHPYWSLFLTIPCFYLIVEPIDKAYRKAHPDGYSDKLDDEHDED